MPDLAPLPCPAPGGLALPELDLYHAVLSGRNARTIKAYEQDYRDFAAFLGASSPAAALSSLIALPPGTAHAAALAYRAHLLDRGLAPATIARRLAALRAAVRLARQLGQVGWSLEIESPKVETYRDTTGPGQAAYTALLGLLRRDGEIPQARRDNALVRLLHDLALRRAEVVGLDLADVDFEQARIHVLGKGKTARVPITLPDSTRHALQDWIGCRGEHPGPLFVRLDRPGSTARLTVGGLNWILAALGRRAGLSHKLRPHGLRHLAITQALDQTGGNVRAVQRFSRHAKLDTLMVYDDNRQDLGGSVARLIAEE